MAQFILHPKEYGGPCFEGEGDCDGDDECEGDLGCGTDNCPWGDGDDWVDCCYRGRL